MKFCQLELKPHSFYLLMIFFSSHIFFFIGLPLFFDDRQIHRPTPILIFEYFLLSMVVYYEILTLAAFIEHTINRSITTKFSRFYLNNMKFIALGGGMAQIFFYSFLGYTTKNLTGAHVKVWSIRLLIVLGLLAFQYLKSSQLLRMKVKELEKLAEQDSISVETYDSKDTGEDVQNKEVDESEEEYEEEEADNHDSNEGQITIK